MQYIAKKTRWASVTPFRIFFCWLIIPLIIMLVDMFIKSYETVEFYQDRVIVRSGVLNKKERKIVFSGVTMIEVHQTLWGRICDYGDLRIDVVGVWNVDTTYIKKPHELKAYLERRAVKKINYTPVA